MAVIDTRGLSCPTPVLMAKKAVEKGNDAVEILVDNNTAKNNVERFLKNAGFSKINFENKEEDILIKANK